jgi:hypothetical protein
MPAVSQAQQRFAAMCLHNAKAAKKKCMPPKVAKEYEKPARKNLPARAPKGGRR